MQIFGIIFCTLLATCRSAILSELKKGKCGLNVTSNYIADSWQTSQYLAHTKKETCFKAHSANNVNSFKFFHSETNNKFADKGYHWFIIALNKTEKIKSVTVKSRSESNVQYRAADIEVFSSKLYQNFGSEHCSASVSSQYNPKMWHYCGKTQFSKIEERYLTVKCDQEVRMLLLRKNVTAGNSKETDRCMNFVDIWLNQIDITDSTSQLTIKAEKGICNRRQPSDDITFFFESPDTSEHACTAYDLNGENVQLLIKNRPTCDLHRNLLRSSWLCENCSRFLNMTVKCTVNGGTSYKIEKSIFVDRSCPKSTGFSLVLASICIAALVIIVLAASLLMFGRKKICLQRSTEESNSGHQLTVLNREVPQKPWLPPDIRTQALSHSQQSLQDIDGSSSNFLNPNNSECCYDTVIQHVKYEPSISSQTNSELTVYLEIISDGSAK